jgi:hypothetical protein
VSSFASEAPESTRGFAAYELPIGTITAKLKVERKNQFLSPLRGAAGKQLIIARVVVELDVTEAEAANWRAGFL